MHGCSQRPQPPGLLGIQAHAVSRTAPLPSLDAPHDQLRQQRRRVLQQRPPLALGVHQLEGR
eukprot:5037099-Lingulodinium_polyedra.AAC.1